MEIALIAPEALEKKAYIHPSSYSASVSWHLKIMEAAEMMEFMDTICSNEFLLRALAVSLPQDVYKDVAAALLTCAHLRGMEPPLLCTLADIELKCTTTETSTLFLRGSSLFSNVLEQYVESSLRGILRQILSPLADSVLNGPTEDVTFHVRIALECLSRGIESLPAPFRYMMDSLRRSALGWFPSSITLETLGPYLGAIFFLRIVNPCIAMPMQFGLLPKGTKVSTEQQRSFVAVSKTLQKMSNQMETPGIGAELQHSLRAMLFQIGSVKGHGERRHTAATMQEISATCENLLDLLRPFYGKVSLWMHTQYPALSWYQYTRFLLYRETITDTAVTLVGKNSNGIPVIQVLGSRWSSEVSERAFLHVLNIVESEPHYSVTLVYSQEKDHLPSDVVAFEWLSKHLSSELPQTQRDKLLKFVVLGAPMASRVGSILNVMKYRSLYKKTKYVATLDSLYVETACTPAMVALPLDAHLLAASNTAVPSSPRSLQRREIKSSTQAAIVIVMAKVRTDMALGYIGRIGSLFNMSIHDVAITKMGKTLQECLCDDLCVNLVLFDDSETLGSILYMYFSSIIRESNGLLPPQIEERLFSPPTPPPGSDLHATHNDPQPRRRAVSKGGKSSRPPTPPPPGGEGEAPPSPVALQPVELQTLAETVASRLPIVAFTLLRELLRIIAPCIQEIQESEDLTRTLGDMLFPLQAPRDRGVDIAIIRNAILQLLTCVSRNIYPLI